MCNIIPFCVTCIPINKPHLPDRHPLQYQTSSAVALFLALHHSYCHVIRTASCCGGLGTRPHEVCWGDGVCVRVHVHVSCHVSWHDSTLLYLFLSNLTSRTPSLGEWLCVYSCTQAQSLFLCAQKNECKLNLGWLQQHFVTSDKIWGWKSGSKGGRHDVTSYQQLVSPFFHVHGNEPTLNQAESLMITTACQTKYYNSKFL